MATMETREIGKFLDITNTGPTAVFHDDKTTVHLFNDDSPSNRMVHFATLIVYLRDQVRNKTIQLYHVGSGGQFANIFCKPLGNLLFHDLRQSLVHGKKVNITRNSKNEDAIATIAKMVESLDAKKIPENPDPRRAPILGGYGDPGGSNDSGTRELMKEELIAYQALVHGPG